MGCFIRSLCCCYTRRNEPVHITEDRGNYDSETIFDMIINGDLEQLKTDFDRGADINLDIVDEEGCNPIHNAVWYGQFDILKLLIEKGARYDEPDNMYSNTPLALAAYNDHPDMIRFLLSLDCNVNNADHELDTPLHYCGRNGMIEITELFIKHGANVNAKNVFGGTPLWYAVKNKHNDLLKTLLDYTNGINDKLCGEDCTEVFSYPEPASPLYVAVENHDLTSVTLLMKAGYKLKMDEWLQLGMAEHTDCYRYLKEWLSNVPTLKDLCRVSIRNIIGINIRKRVLKLEIPEQLKGFLLLKE